MKIIPNPKRIAAYGLALTLTGLGAYASSGLAGAEFDPTTLENTVATQSEQLKDHDNRISNLEAQTAQNSSAIAGVQTAIGQPVTPNVPVLTTSETAALTGTPSPTPVVVSATKKIVAVTVIQKPVNNLITQSYYLYEYDDGSTSESPVLSKPNSNEAIPPMGVGTSVPL